MTTATWWSVLMSISTEANELHGVMVTKGKRLTRSFDKARQSRKFNKSSVISEESDKCVSEGVGGWGGDLTRQIQPSGLDPSTSDKQSFHVVS